MTIRAYLWGMRICTLAALVSLVLVVTYINPVKDGILGQVLFYVSLYFAVTGMATLFLFWIRRVFFKKSVIQENVGVSFRQSALIAAAICLLLLLQSFRLLVWWDAGIVIAGTLLTELWFLSK